MGGRIPSTLAAAAILIAFTWAAPVTQAQAASSFDLPTQPLADSLRAVGSQTDTNVLFDPPLVANRKAPALKGDLTADQAITRLLIGTGIGHHLLNEKTIVLTAAGPPASAPSEQSSLPTDQNHGSATDQRDEDSPPGASGDKSKRSRANRLHLAQMDQGAPSGPAQVKRRDGAGEDTSDQNVEEVIVTGSHIAREALRTDEAVSTVSGEYIKERGITNVADAINQMPATIGTGFTPQGFQNTFNIGANYINLFDLGSQRTLTLVDGHRFVSNNPLQFQTPIEAGSQVDLNSLPTLFIDRVEQISATGAAVYGSDAMAGVVNIVTKRKFEGLDASLQGGVSKYGDAPQYTAKIAGGRTVLDGALNIAADVEYDRTSGFIQADRPFCGSGCRFVANPNGGPPAQILVRNATFPTMTPGGLPYNLNDGNIVLPGTATPVQFSPNGQLIPYNPGQVYNPLVAVGGEGLNWPTIYPLYSGSERKLVTAMANFEPSTHFRLRGQIYFAYVNAHDPVEQPEAAFPPFFGVGGTFGAYDLSINNAFLSSQARSILQANGITSDFYLSRANTDWTSDRVFQRNQTLQGVLSLEGDFRSFNRPFTYQVAFTDGESKSGISQTSFIFGNPAYGVPNLLAYALDAVQGPSGQVICNIQAQNPSSTNPYIRGCVPLNPFGTAHDNAAALAYSQVSFINHSVNEQSDLQASIGSSLMSLPAGDWKFSVGYEHRRESASFVPGTAALEGIGSGPPTLPQDDAYHTDEYYAETLLPIIGTQLHVPLVRRFDLDGAFRRVRNSLAGLNDAWSYGAQLSPVDGLILRGSRSRTFRNPSLVELFTTSSSQFDIGTDPCQASNLNAGSNPGARQRNCAAAFVAAGLPANYQLGSSNIQNGASPVTVAGNPDLQNETGRSWTAGIAANPTFAPGLRLSADYINVNIIGAIEFEAIAALLVECYDSPTYPTAACSQFSRTATGQITGPGGVVTGPNETFINSGYLRLKGVSYSAVYDRNVAELPFVRTERNLGSIGLSIAALNTRDLTASVSGLGFDQQQLAGTLSSRGGGTRGSSAWKLRADLRYGDGPLQTLWTTQFISRAVFDQTLTAADQEPLGVGNYYRHSLAAQYLILPKVTVRLNVNNIFNRQPPIPSNGSGVYDVLGRYYYMGVEVRF